MKTGLISLLLREGVAGALAGELLKRALRRAIAIVLFYAILAALALAALVFLFVLIYRWLVGFVGDIPAAAILCGGNLALAALMMIVRSLFRKGPRHRRNSVAETLAEPSLDAGVAIGRKLGRVIRKAAPEIALTAAVIGLLIGLRPQILGAFGRSKTSPGKTSGGDRADR